jgi:uncharacterized protein YjbJ (UPF0337 family)
MNRYVSRGKLKQMKSDSKKEWGKLTDDDLDVMDGERQMMSGKREEHFGHEEDKVDRVYENLRSAPGD